MDKPLTWGELARQTKYAHDKTEVPTGPHYAALVFKTISIPGDERSRTHPGHGYGPTTESAIDYIVFQSKEAMEAWVSKEESSKFSHTQYRLIRAEPLEIKTTVTII